MHELRETTAESLMLLYQSHLDAGAFEEIVARFLAPALAVAKQLLADASLAEDAVQETFLRLVSKRKQYDPALPFSSWFYTVLRNVCRDMLRRRSRHAAALKDVAAHRTVRPPIPPALGEDLRTTSLATLPERNRVVLHLRIVDRLSFREVGKALGISEEAAKKRAQRGLRQLRGKRALRSADPDTRFF